jgi:hypothetical protein
MGRLLWFVVGGIATAVGLGIASSMWDDHTSGSASELPSAGESMDSAYETGEAEENETLEG